MKNYYFLASALPPLKIGIKPDLGFEEFVSLLKINLSPYDYTSSVVLRRFYDIENIKAYWKKEPFNPFGNYNFTELEDALFTEIGLPNYVFDFLQEHESLQERLAHFSSLIVKFFATESENSTGFLKKYLKFEREWRLVLTALRAKLLGREIITEMQHEDPDDPFIAEIIAQKDAKNYTPPAGYLEIKELFEIYLDDPLLMHQAINEYRFRYIEETLGVDLFSIDRIIGYMAELIIAEEWEMLDEQRGLLNLKQALE